MVGSGNRDASTTSIAEADSTGTTQRGTGMVGSGN
jgi:hypothetical protein